MAKRNYDDYEYVDPEVVKRAATMADQNACEIIFNRYEKEIDAAVRNALRKSKLSYDQTLFNEIRNTVWIELKEEILRYRPK